MARLCALLALLATALVALGVYAPSGSEAASTPREAAAHAAKANAFGYALYPRVVRAGRNAAFSPLSAHEALTMAYAGASRRTRRQLAAALRLGRRSEPLVHRDVAALRAALERAENERVRLDVANGAWGQEGMAFEQPFLDVLDRRYAGAFHRTPFDADPEAARVGINRWISERTAARIPELFGRGDITRLTRLVLANAIYLRADWQTPFDQRNTGDARFHRLDGPPVSVRMMRRRGEIRWATGGDWEAVELPYVGDRLAMLVVAPRRGRFRRVERRLGARFVRGVVRRLRKSDLLLGLPKFELRTEIELTRPLGALGVRDAFDPERADFGRMTKADRLRISRVRQEVFLRVDEKGTEAAAATGIVFERVSRPPSITVDRPFLFALRDRRTGAVLFVGRVLRPQASTK